MEMTDNRKRQHPLWIILKIVSSIREVIIPIIYFFIINMKNESTFIKYGSIALIIYMIFRVITILLEWKNNTYLFTDKNLELIEGRLISKKRYISLNRIQSVQQHTSFLHRLFGLTSLNITTGTTGDNATVKLEMITLNEAKTIQMRLNEHKEKELSSEEVVSSFSTNNLTEHYQITLREIVIFSMTSLYFLASIPIILSIYFKIEDFFSLDRYTEQWFSFLKQSWVLIGTVVMIGIMILTIAGIVVTYFRYGNYTVSSNEERIFITRGVFTKTSFSIPKNKINGISMNKGMVRRLFRIIEVELIIVGDLIDETEMKTNVLFPMINEERAKKLLTHILPAFKINEKMKSLPSQSLFIILIRPSYLLVIMTVFIFFFWPEYWFVPFLYAFLLILSRLLEFKFSQYRIEGNDVQIKTGSFSTTLFITRREKIDQFEMGQTWIQQKLNVASLSITTRGQPIYNAQLSHISIHEAERYRHWYTEQFFHSKYDNSPLQTNS